MCRQQALGGVTGGSAAHARDLHRNAAPIEAARTLCSIAFTVLIKLVTSFRLVKPVCDACSGKEDPGAPQRADKERKRTYKTKDEVNKTRGLTSTIVLVLLFISVAVPMLQYWGYTSKE